MAKILIYNGDSNDNLERGDVISVCDDSVKFGKRETFDNNEIFIIVETDQKLEEALAYKDALVENESVKKVRKYYLSIDADIKKSDIDKLKAEKDKPKETDRKYIKIVVDKNKFKAKV